MTRLRLASAAALALASIVLVSGCGAQPGGFEDLRGERESRDELPQPIADQTKDRLDVATTRYVGEHEGTSLWLAQGKETSTVCLVAAAEENWIVGCGSAPTTVSSPAGIYEVVADGVPSPERAVKISENVYAW